LCFIDISKHFSRIERPYDDIALCFVDIAKHFVDIERLYDGIALCFVDIAKHFVGIERLYDGIAKLYAGITLPKFTIPPYFIVHRSSFIVEQFVLLRNDYRTAKKERKHRRISAVYVAGGRFDPRQPAGHRIHTAHAAPSV
jgi:hypothetical protein